MHSRHTSPHVKIFNDLLIVGHAWTDEGHLFFIIWGFIRERFRKTIQNKGKKSERGGESTKLTSRSNAMYCFVFCCGDFRNSLYLKMKMEKKLQKSIHPSIFCHLSRSGMWWQQFKQRYPELPLPTCDIHHLALAVSSMHFQASWDLFYNLIILGTKEVAGLWSTADEQSMKIISLRKRK